MLPLGSLAGQVGVGVAASDGQLVVRLSAPSRGDYYTPGEQQTFGLAGNSPPAKPLPSSDSAAAAPAASTPPWQTVI